MKKFRPLSAEETREKFIPRVVQELTDAGDYPSLEARHNVASKWWEAHERSVGENIDPDQVQHARMFIDTVQKADGDDEERRATFIASTATEDRQGDTIQQDGWDLKSFKKNPVLLFGHNSRDLPIGKVENIKVEDGKLMAKTVGVDAGVHDLADKVWKMIGSGFLNAVSVGFRALDYEPRFGKDGEWLGMNFLKQELLELSVVPVPANPQAVMVARCYGSSHDQVSEMFDGDIDKHWDALVQSEFRQRQLEIMRLRTGVSV